MSNEDPGDGKYSAIGSLSEQIRELREMFNYARDHQPCKLFMDEIDAIGGRRFSEDTSADREIQRTLMELLNQMDGFDALGKDKFFMATNRPDTLDPAEIDYEACVKLSDNFNGADLLNVWTEAGLFAIRAEREYLIPEDFMKAERKVSDNKKLVIKLDYKPV